MQPDPQAAQLEDRRRKNPDLPDPGADQGKNQQYQSKTGVMGYGGRSLSISARKVASGVTPTCRAAILPSWKISRAGIEEIP